MARAAILCILCIAPAFAAESCGGNSCKAKEEGEISALIQSQLIHHHQIEIPSLPAFIQEHGRTYQEGSEEYEMRSKIYSESVRKVEQHNSNPNRRWTAGINYLADFTEDEFSQLRGLRAMQAEGTTLSQSAPIGFIEDQSEDLPDEKTWTNLLAVKAFSDQGSCGSCWALASATVLSANAEVKGHAHEFAPQELVSCVPNPHKCGGTGGCLGSTVELAMNWVMAKGLASKKEVPYMWADLPCKKAGGLTSFLSIDGDTNTNGAGTGLRHYNHAKLADMIAVGFHGGETPASKAISLGGWERLPQNEYEPLKRAVAQVGPVAVSVGAGPWALYSHGIFDSCGKDSEIDHAVVLIGYGKEGKDKYWTIKNSWGATWGEELGTIRLLREETNGHCGTDRQPKMGTGCDDSPPSVKVCGMCGILYDSVVPHFHKKA